MKQKRNIILAVILLAVLLLLPFVHKLDKAQPENQQASPPEACRTAMVELPLA